MTAEPGSEAAILFVDVSGSTRYFERYGEVAGRAMIAGCFDIVVPQIGRYGGKVVKTLGDGLLAVFDRASDLVGAARAVHLAIEEANRARPVAERVFVHCGGDFGPVAHDAAGDVYGDTVNVAARLQVLAARDKTFVTSDVVTALDPGEREQMRYLGSFPVEGRDAEVETYEVLWAGGRGTVAITRSPATLRSHLLVEFKGTVLELAPDRNGLTMGRDSGNDLVVEDAAVSHDHAEIVRRKGLFYLIDRSTNGTFLQLEGKAERHIRHEEHPLEGQGRLLLGHTQAPPIMFRVTQQMSQEPTGGTHVRRGRDRQPGE
jgi:adenylate cyclase